MVVIKPVSVFRAIQCHATQGVVSVTALPASKASTVVKSVMLAHMALDVALNAIAMLFIRKNRQNAMQLMAIAPVKRDGREKDVHEDVELGTLGENALLSAPVISHT